MRIDLKELMEFLACDEQFLVRLMRKFIEESGTDIERLKASTDAGNWPLVRATAHKILSSTRIFNMIQLSNHLESIEIIAARGTDVNVLPGKVEEVEKEWKAVVEEVNLLLRQSRQD